MKKKTKIWVGVGAFVVAGSGAVTPGPVPADASTWATSRALADLTTDTAIRCAPMSASIVLAQAAAGGEGEAGPIDLPPDLAFARIVALIRGHLLVGDQLVKEKQWNAAFPHFMHPTEELYNAIRGTVKDYATPQFDGALKELAAAVKARSEAKYAPAWKKVDDALAVAEAGVKSKQQSDWPAFTLRVVLEVIKTSGSEYEAAVEKKRIKLPVEYQDARGFILHGEKLVEAVAADLEKKNADALKTIRADFAQLKAVFPTAMPPKTPIKDPSFVLGLVSRVELAAGGLM